MANASNLVGLQGFGRIVRIFARIAKKRLYDNLNNNLKHSGRHNVMCASWQEIAIFKGALGDSWNCTVNSVDYPFFSSVFDTDLLMSQSPQMNGSTTRKDDITSVATKAISSWARKEREAQSLNIKRKHQTDIYSRMSKDVELRWVASSFQTSWGCSSP